MKIIYNNQAEFVLWIPCTLNIGNGTIGTIGNITIGNIGNGTIKYHKSEKKKVTVITLMNPRNF